MEKIKITINGREIETSVERTVLRTALDNGIHIPHYCYHPGLSIAGNCRMCLVEIEGIPKLQTSCSTYCRDGMVVYTDNDRVQTAVRQVLEFLLINHPVDCPVCDQAGECWLQIYYMSVGRHNSRFTGNKVTKHKKATPIGDKVILDQERCILCSRCVRFTNEITKTNEMAIFNRGDHCEIDTYPGRQLENRYSANIMDICPVGALTCRDFRFKCRVWYLSSTASICPSCSRGCNIFIHHNPHRPHKDDGRRVMRLKPRANPNVNQHWMCDDGRYNYSFIDENRLRYGLIRTEGVPEKHVQPLEAIQKLAVLLKNTPAEKCLYLVSPDSSNEELFSARKLFKDLLHIRVLIPDAGVRTGDSDDFLIQEDKHPNTTGALRIFGLDENDLFSLGELSSYLEQCQIRLLIVNRAELSPETLARIKELKIPLIFLGTNGNETAEAADLVIPVATFAEKEGSFTNKMNRIQRFYPAFPAVCEAKPEWDIFADIADTMGLDGCSRSAGAIFDQMSAQFPFLKNLSFNEIGPNGVPGSNE